MTIRRADKGDAAVLAALERACFSRPWGEKALTEVLANPMVTCLAAVDNNGAVLGYGFVTRVLDEGSLDQLAVCAECRRRGVGGVLLRTLLEESGRQGIAKVFLEVRASNAAALGLYRQMGFQEIARRRRYYDDPVEDAVILAFCGSNPEDCVFV